MTRFRKVLLGVAIAAAVTIPVGVAYADGSDGGGSHNAPVSGMMHGGMDPADCQHSGQHQAHMGGQGMQMNGMHAQTGSGRMAGSRGSMCDRGSSTRSGI